MKTPKGKGYKLLDITLSLYNGCHAEEIKGILCVCPASLCQLAQAAISLYPPINHSQSGDKKVDLKSRGPPLITPARALCVFAVINDESVCGQNTRHRSPLANNAWHAGAGGGMQGSVTLVRSMVTSGGPPLSFARG